MGTYYWLLCSDCKIKADFVAVGGDGCAWLAPGAPDSIRLFMDKHGGHDPVIASEHIEGIYDYEDIEKEVECQNG